MERLAAEQSPVAIPRVHLGEFHRDQILQHAPAEQRGTGRVGQPVRQSTSDLDLRDRRQRFVTGDPLMVEQFGDIQRHPAHLSARNICNSRQLGQAEVTVDQ
jgi:hypothetical protein